ncbi:MAG: biotin/lipoate A/B protein ligase family protein [Thermodesulfovibrionales bacterium]|nr:biotin/lipoate A/B protein ligase family protein [Thermodesulfovibrionales bacterium]
MTIEADRAQYWRLIDSDPCDAAYNMALDEAIAISTRKGFSPPTLRLYGWKVLSVSLGSFQKISDIDFQYCINNKIPVVRRPTGGRAILHGDELTYSFSAKNKGDFSGGLLDTYRKLSTAFYTALHCLGLAVSIKMQRESGGNLTKNPLCFKSTSYGEISFSGNKLIGSAQKRWSHGFLQQGSIPFSIKHCELEKVFRTYKPDECGNMLGLRELVINLDIKKFKNHIKSSFEETFKVVLADSQPAPHELELVQILSAQKYQNHLWTMGEAKSIRSHNNNGITLKASQGLYIPE